jgi:hypothetical protein
MEKALAEEESAIVNSCDPAILARAVHYLFTKETKSSFAIEGEAPSKDRTERFVAALMKASGFDATSKDAFVQLQNAIVDPRYAQKDWRTAQNFVSQTLPDYSEDVHLVCPKPGDVPDLMNAWREMVRRLELREGIDPVVAAVVTAFGFVFIRPFDDGNGRIHRFLVHHKLARLGFTPPGILFPVSTAMLRDRRPTTRFWSAFQIRSCLSFVMTLTWNREWSSIMIPLGSTGISMLRHKPNIFISASKKLHRDLRDEIGFLTAFDAALRAVLNIVDMPNRKASLLVRFILQNKGRLSKGKRPTFSEISDQEID